MKASIQLTLREADQLGWIFDNKGVDCAYELTCYGVIWKFTEHQLEKFLYYLPLDHDLRSRFQNAGESVFKW